MPINIPRELKSYFTEQDFSSYPIIRIPQYFSDDRGVIFNLAGGKLGDVAVINFVIPEKISFILSVWANTLLAIIKSGLL